MDHCLSVLPFIKTPSHLTINSICEISRHGFEPGLRPWLNVSHAFHHHFSSEALKDYNFSMVLAWQQSCLQTCELVVLVRQQKEEQHRDGSEELVRMTGHKKPQNIFILKCVLLAIQSSFPQDIIPQGFEPPWYGRSAFTASQLVRVQHVAFLLVFAALRVSLSWPRSFLWIKGSSQAIHCQWCPQFTDGAVAYDRRCWHGSGCIHPLYVIVAGRNATTNNCIHWLWCKFWIPRDCPIWPGMNKCSNCACNSIYKINSDRPNILLLSLRRSARQLPRERSW